MSTLSDSLAIALALVRDLDPHVVAIVELSVRVSLASTLCAALIGMPLGASLAIAGFRGRTAVIAALNAMIGLPPV